MSIRKEHFVRFLSPGTFFSEETTRPISEWDLAEAVRLSELIMERHGAKPFGFQFLTKVVSDPIADGAGGTLEVEPKVMAKSTLYYIGGNVRSYDDIVAQDSEHNRILLSNMRGNGWPFVVENTRSYQVTHPFDGNVAIVDVSGVVVRTPNDPDLLETRQNIEKRWAAEDAKSSE